MVSVRPSVRLSVCPSYRPLQQRAAGLLLWDWRTDGIDRLLHGAQQQRRRSRKCAAAENARAVSRS